MDDERRRWKPALRPRTLARLLVLVFVLHVFVIPQIGGARDALDTVTGVSPLLLGVALALETAAILAYAQLTRSLLASDGRPSLGICFGAVLASLGVSHVVPGGAATTAAVNFRLFDLAGVPGTELAFVLATQPVGSAVVLNLILWAALIVSVPASGFHLVYATAAAAGAVLMVLSGLAIVGLVRGQDRMARWADKAARRSKRFNAEKVSRVVTRIGVSLSELGNDVPRLRAAILLAAANWLLDAAALWVCLAAFGHRADIVGLLVAYGLANVLAAIPVAPGGLGVVEAVLIPTLVGFGSPASVAAVGVVAYRLLSFWLPIPTGLAAFAIIERRLGGHGGRARARPEIDNLVGSDTTSAERVDGDRAGATEQTCCVRLTP